MRTLPPTVVALLALLLGIAMPTAVLADEPTTTRFDRWYVIELAGKPAGYAHMTERQKGDRIITQSDIQFAVRRGEDAIEVKLDTWFVETVDGQPLEASSTIKPGAMAIVQHVKFTDAGIEVTTGTGGGARTTTSPRLPESYLPPAAAQRRVEAQIAEGATDISADIIEISMGVTPVTTTMKIVGHENIEVYGKVVPAVVWDVNVSIMPGMTVRHYTDEQGRDIKTTAQFMPGMDLVMIEADEQLAKARIDPPRVLAQTLIRPEGTIANPRQTRRAVYQLSVRGDQPMSLARTGYQRVVWDDKTTAAVVLDLDQPVNVIDDLPTDADSQPSDMIDYENEAVQELLELALIDVPEDAPDHVVAGRLRAFVHRHIDEKDLSVGLAKAGQVARTAQGDCTEHAVLLCALLRAKGIPARTVTGVMYVDDFLGEEGVFGYHAWTQAWLEADDAGSPAGGRWVDLDATLPGQDFDATHIAMSVSSMADGQMINDMIEMLPMFNGLRIKIKQAE